MGEDVRELTEEELERIDRHAAEDIVSRHATSGWWRAPGRSGASWHAAACARGQGARADATPASSTRSRARCARPIHAQGHHAGDDRKAVERIVGSLRTSRRELAAGSVGSRPPGRRGRQGLVQNSLTPTISARRRDSLLTWPVSASTGMGRVMDSPSAAARHPSIYARQAEVQDDDVGANLCAMARPSTPSAAVATRHPRAAGIGRTCRGCPRRRRPRGRAGPALAADGSAIRSRVAPALRPWGTVSC